MNYRIYFIGLNRDLIHTIIKLFILTAEEGDYLVNVSSKLPDNPFYPLCYEVMLKGSEKNGFVDIHVDFDNYLMGVNTDLSPSTLMINIDRDGKHYWYMLGLLFKKIDDLSTAFITGYLVDKKMDPELKNFRSV